MFDDFFNRLKDAFLAKAKEAVDELGKRLAVPEPAAPLMLVRQFTLDDDTVTKGGIALINGCWQIEAYDQGRNQFVSMSEPLRSVIYSRCVNRTFLSAFLRVDFRQEHATAKNRLR